MAHRMFDRMFYAGAAMTATPPGNAPRGLTSLKLKVSRRVLFRYRVCNVAAFLTARPSIFDSNA